MSMYNASIAAMEFQVKQQLLQVLVYQILIQHKQVHLVKNITNNNHEHKFIIINFYFIIIHQMCLFICCVWGLLVAIYFFFGLNCMIIGEVPVTMSPVDPLLIGKLNKYDAGLVQWILKI